MDQAKRVNYFQGMMLVDEDFRDEQNYHRQTRHNHNLELHTWGVVRGLEVSLKAGALDVTEGLAIDANGKEIWWKGGAATAAGKPDDGVYLVVEWNEEPSDDYLQMAGKYLRLIDTCKLSFKKAAEANDVVLAKISVQDGQIQERPDNSVRRTASSVRANGGDLEIRPVASNGSLRLMTGAPSTARLTIDAKGNIGIGTPPTGARLSINADPYEGTLMDFSVGDIYKLRLGYRSFERDSVSYHFDLANNLGNKFDKFLVFHKGNVAIANDLSVKGALSVKGGVTLRVNPDDSPDPSHGISYFGAGAKDVVGEFGFDGPVLYGFSGGALGTWREKKEDKKVVLCWKDSGRVGIGTDDPKSKLDVQGAANIWSGARHAVPNNFMAPGSLTIGNINANFGGGTTGWNTNTAGLLLETLDNTEIAVHDSNKRVASLMYYEGGDVNRITIGRQMDPSWGAISTLALNGNVGIGTSNPAHKLDVYGSASNYPGRVASPDGYLRFGPANGSWCHFETDRPRFWFNTGITVNTGNIASYGNDLTFLTGDYVQMKIKSDSGNVGIGTDNPTRGKVEIIGSVRSSFGQLGYLTSFNVATDVYNPTVRNGTVQVPVGLVGSNEGPISLYSDNIIAAASCWAFSDERIKHIEGRSDAARDLSTLMGIEVTEYRYKDVIGKGDGLHKKVIAQQVEKVFPQAVSKQTDVVPDLYQQASLMDGWVELATDLKKGERVRLISDKAEGVYEVLEVVKDKFRVDFKHEGDKVFVFGREVNDFLNVDYDAIAMLNVSATQQLKKEKDEEVKVLRAEIAELSAANDELTKRLQLLESKMETASGVVVAQTSNGNGRRQQSMI